LAFFGWFLGALGHDAGHFAVSHHAKVNDICVWGMSLLCNPILWQHQHTYAHHSHTNDFDRDPDLHHFTMLLRVHRNFQHQPLYEWQRNPLFVTLAYTLVVFGTCIWIPIGMLQEGSLYGMVEYTDRNRPWRAFGMMAHWVGYTSVILLLPFFVCTSWYRALASIIVHIATSGLMFGFFSQVNHLNEHSMEAATSRTATRNNNNTSAATAASSSKTLCAANSWAAAQVESSNNFCTNSSLWHILSNGLNLQIEHHLFPGLNHSHLHRIAPVVKATCEEYGVMYKTYDSWSELMKATLEWLDKLSIEA
jgi:fatty acid desaturase